MNKEKLDLILNEIDEEFRDSLLYIAERKFNHVGDYFTNPIYPVSFSKRIYFLVIIFRSFLKYLLFTKRKNLDNYVLCATTNIKIISRKNYFYPLNIGGLSKNSWGNLNYLLQYFKMLYFLENFDLNKMNTQKFQKNIEKYCNILNENLENCTDIIVDQDMGFFENILIKVAKQKNIRTHLYFHGLKAWYNDFDEHRCDYLYVWGEQMRNNYIQHGYPAKKIFSIGHPILRLNETREICFDLNRVLVLTKPINGANPSYSDFFSANLNCLYYLLQIEEALKSKGVRNATVRVHPSENINWYKAKLSKFWQISKSPKEIDIEQHTICIGPTSTFMLDSISKGLNYLAFEPTSRINTDIHGLPLVPPFDKSDERISVSFNQSELINALNNRVFVDRSIFKDYVKDEFNSHGFKFNEN
jgi:hypothetical protein